MSKNEMEPSEEPPSDFSVLTRNLGKERKELCEQVILTLPSFEVQDVEDSDSDADVEIFFSGHNWEEENPDEYFDGMGEAMGEEKSPKPKQKPASNQKQLTTRAPPNDAGGMFSFEPLKKALSQTYDRPPRPRDIDYDRLDEADPEELERLTANFFTAAGSHPPPQSLAASLGLAAEAERYPEGEDPPVSRQLDLLSSVRDVDFSKVGEVLEQAKLGGLRWDARPLPEGVENEDYVPSPPPTRSGGRGGGVRGERGGPPPAAGGRGGYMAQPAVEREDPEKSPTPSPPPPRLPQKPSRRPDREMVMEYSSSSDSGDSDDDPSFSRPQAGRGGRGRGPGRGRGR